MKPFLICFLIVVAFAGIWFAFYLRNDCSALAENRFSRQDVWTYRDWKGSCYTITRRFNVVGTEPFKGEGKPVYYHYQYRWDKRWDKWGWWATAAPESTETFLKQMGW